MTDALFESFFLGGFECSSHRLASGRRLDLIEATRHDEFAFEDYARLRDLGLRAARDGLRWHRIETSPRRYDWSSVLPLLDAARRAGVQIVWDLFHYGWPDDLDIFSPDFVDRFAQFARAFAQLLAREGETSPLITPVNEISWFAFAGGHAGYLNPFATWRAPELKLQLVRAAIKAMQATREVLPQARFAHTEPLIHIVPDPEKPHQQGLARWHHDNQFEALEMLAGRTCPELGGRPEYLDIVGINYYPYNQWMHDEGGPPSVNLFPGDELHRPLHLLLADVYARYGRPVFVAETGCEDGGRAAWLRYVCDEVCLARESGVPVGGVCLYPILNHPGWDNGRHCHNGLWDYADDGGGREAHGPLAAELRRQTRRFENEVRAAAD